MGLTTDRTDPCLRETDPDTGQQVRYLILSAKERAKGFVRPVRSAYKHTACGCVTIISVEIAETYARNPAFYGRAWCTECRQDFPVAAFVWVDDGSVVGS